MKYDIIGDIHGCFQEFQDLTTKLGYSWASGLLYITPNESWRSLVILQTEALIHYV